MIEGMQMCKCFIMRNLWISRSNQPHVASLSQLFLSLATGVVLVLHYSYLKPLLAEPYNNIQSAMVFILLVTLVRTLLLFCLLRKGKEPSGVSQNLTKRNLLYPGMVRAGVYLSVVILAVGDRYLSMTIVSVSILGFIFWLVMCAKDNEVSQRIDRGRHYSRNPLKISLLYALTILAVGLQPQQYYFAFELHFQIFIIFIASLLLFSYFYIHRIVLTFTTRDKGYRLLAWQSFFELLSLLLIWFYFFFMEQQGLPIAEQLSYLSANWWAVLVVAVFSTLYEMVLWEHVRKVALSQLAITLATGFTWFNIYQMIISDIDLRLYISVFVMAAVLLVNIGLFSEANLKRIQKALTGKPTKRKKAMKRDNLSEGQ